jgi:hypothetical protein
MKRFKTAVAVRLLASIIVFAAFLGATRAKAGAAADASVLRIIMLWRAPG